MKLFSQKLKQTVPYIWVLILLDIYGKIVAELTCHQCYGINCLRTSYKATQNCINSLDICATVFDGQTVVAQGCLEQLSEELRDKCRIGKESTRNSQEGSAKFSECFKCHTNLCNNLASESFECIQCDSKIDENCHSKPKSLKPTRCPVSRTINEYCFVKREGATITRGCSHTLEEQTECLLSGDCMICQASEISGCNAVAFSENDSNSSGSGNGNGSGGSSEEGSTNGSGGSEADGSGNGESATEPGSDGAGATEGGSAGNEGSNSGNENNGGSTDSGESSKGSSIAVTNSYIFLLILSVTASSVSVFLRK